jgi:ankyrin repeat protein
MLGDGLARREQREYLRFADRQLGALRLAKGAEENARDDQGHTPLDRAVEWHRDSVAALIRQYGGLTGARR